MDADMDSNADTNSDADRPCSPKPSLMPYLSVDFTRGKIAYVAFPAYTASRNGKNQFDQ